MRSVSAKDASIQRARATLPLPPKLPYSPTSHPFKRHLEALSLAIVSDSPDGSWTVYDALHSDLRRCIPDDLFRSLLRHQLSESRIKQRWARMQDMLDVWKQCGLSLEALGQEILEGVLDTGLGYHLGTIAGQAVTQANAMDLHTLFKATIGLQKRKSDMETKLKRSWLRFVATCLQDRSKRAAMWMSAHEALHIVLDAGDIGGLEPEILLLLRLPVDVEDQAMEVLKAAVRCSNKGMRVSDGVLLRCMSAVAKSPLRAIRPDPRPANRRVETMIREAGIGVVVQRYLHLWRQMVRQAEPVADAADRLLRSSAVMQNYGWDSEEDQRSAMDVLRGAHDVDDLFKVLQYCKRLAKVGAEWAELYGALATAVSRRYTETLQSGVSDQFAVLVDDFLNLPPPARTANRTLRRVLDLALQRTSESGYNAARRLYASVRAVDFAWRHNRYGQLKSLFHAALDHSHNQMASRLYTDALADRLVPGRAECLRLIRSVCGARNASRPVLIERLIRDYVAFHSSDQDKAMLINAVAEGLTEGRSEDAVLALAIIKRLVPADMVPEAIDMRLIACLARVPLQRQRAAILDILDRAPETHTNLSQLYEVAISSLAKLANLQKGSDLSPSAAVALCTDLYRQMIQRNISPGRRTLSSLIVALIKDRQLDTALQVFEKASQLHHVRSDAVGRLIIACALSGRLSDAEEVERKWRSGQAGDSYDKGVTGARVLVDTLKGEKVDFELVHRKTGWRPTKAYLLFIQEHIKAQGQPREQEAEMPEPVYQSMRANGAGGVEAGDEDLCDTPHAVSYAC